MLGLPWHLCSTSASQHPESQKNLAAAWTPRGSSFIGIGWNWWNIVWRQCTSYFPFVPRTDLQWHKICWYCWSDPGKFVFCWWHPAHFFFMLMTSGTKPLYVDDIRHKSFVCWWHPAQNLFYVNESDTIFFMLITSGTKPLYVDGIRHIFFFMLTTSGTIFLCWWHPAQKLCMLMASGTKPLYVDDIRHKFFCMLMTSGTFFLCSWHCLMPGCRPLGCQRWPELFSSLSLAIWRCQKYRLKLCHLLFPFHACARTHVVAGDVHVGLCWCCRLFTMHLVAFWFQGSICLLWVSVTRMAGKRKSKSADDGASVRKAIKEESETLDNMVTMYRDWMFLVFIATEWHDWICSEKKDCSKFTKLNPFLFRP